MEVIEYISSMLWESPSPRVIRHCIGDGTRDLEYFELLQAYQMVVKEMC